MGQEGDVRSGGEAGCRQPGRSGEVPGSWLNGLGLTKLSFEMDAAASTVQLNGSTMTIN